MSIAKRPSFKDKYDNFIGGKFVPPVKGEYFDNISPIDGKPFTKAARSTKEDIDAAVDAATEAFKTWSKTSATTRSNLLLKIAQVVEDNLSYLATVETIDNGKAIRETMAADLPLVVDHFRYFAGAIRAEESSISEHDEFTVSINLQEPLGVVGQIIPWNFPLLMATWKIAPALAAGCCTVVKPAEQTPLSALRLGELIMEAGFPEGVVNIVPGYGETAGAALAAHPDVDKVAFTGSTEVGKLIVHAATGNLKKVSLELGGKSPNVVFKDSDLETAIPGAASAIFFNHGQCCCAGSRLYVEKAVYDRVVEGVAEHARKIKVGSGLEPDTQMGPLVSEEQLKRVCGYLESGFSEGAKAVAGGRKAGDRGYFVEPTVLVDTNENMKVVQEEIFGPVVTAMPFTDPEEIIPRANNSDYGLAAAVWTRDVSKAHHVAEQLRAGTVWINCYNIFDAALPFGGYKQSGWGREMGHDALNLYTQTKAVCARFA